MLRQEIPHREPLAVEPNDLPMVCLPLELSGHAAEKLIDFLYQLTDALERHYSGLLINRAHQLAPQPAAAAKPSERRHAALSRTATPPANRPRRRS